jgi:NTE family protein
VPRPNAPDPNSSRVAVVAAGAGARGAYEAGALSVLLPWLEAHDQRPDTFVGTSAGAINAGLLAATRHLPAEDSAAELLGFWNRVTVGDIVRSPAESGSGTLLSYVGQVLGFGTVGSLLDTTPMLAFAEATFAPFREQLRTNIDSGLVKALAMIATDTSQRSIVFCDLAPGVKVPGPNAARAITYRRTQVGARHVLASSAIPALFRPIEVDGEWYVDGGARLNVPLAPAVALGATDVAVVATHPSTYPAPRPADEPSRAPTVVDAAAQLVSSALADRMVEDLATLDKLNRVAEQAPVPGEARLIPRLFVGPRSRGELGDLAQVAYDERARPLLGPLRDNVAFAHLLLGRNEPRAGDLLSYLFFEPEFLAPAIALGQRHARARIRSAKPWLPA